MTISTQDRRYPQFTIGWRLRLARTQLGPDMDAARFADLIGVSRGTVTNYELEKTPAGRMRPIVLNAWALATGVDVEWLRTGARPNENDPRRQTPDEGQKLPDLDSNQEPAGYGIRSRRHGMAAA